MFTARSRVLALLPLLIAAQRVPSPGIAFTSVFDDGSVEGIVEESSGVVYVTVNQKWQDALGFDESWVHKLDGSNGQVLQSQQLGRDRSKVGACTLIGDESTLIINPFTGDSDYNVGIMAVRTDTLETLWTSNVIRESDQGVPPIITKETMNGSVPELIVYYSTRSGIAVLDERGRTVWATTTIRTARIAVTPDTVYAVDQSPRLGYPINAYSLSSGELKGSSGPFEGASTNVGVVVSPDLNWAYTVRSGLEGGLYRNIASFLFKPSELVTSQVSAGKFGETIPSYLLMVIESYKVC